MFDVHNGGVANMKTWGALIIFTLLAFRSLCADNRPANISELTYEQLKQMFEKDESLADVRIANYTASSVTLIYKGRHLNYELKKLSTSQRIRIDELIAHEKGLGRAAAIKENEAAARAGLLREVDGVVYNLQKLTPDRVTFNNVKVLQKTDAGLLVDIAKSRYDLTLIFVKNLPQYNNAADGDAISFVAKQTGTYTYITRAKVDKTVREYDCGVMPGKAKMPDLVQAPDPKRSALDAKWDSSGTGFFITEDGYLATCNHVVKGGKIFSVRNSAGTFTARVVATDETNDVAILKVTGRFTPLVVNTNILALGQPAFTIGFPNIDVQGLAPKYTDGKVSSLSGIRDDANEFQISVPVQPGNSGGPLTDAGGNVIGIIVARLNDYAALKRMKAIPQNVNYAVKTAPLVTLIRQAGIQAKVQFTSVAEQKDSAVKRVEQAAVLILVSE